MKLEASWWSRFKWFVQRLIEFRKKSYPLSALGAKLLALSILGGSLSTYVLRVTLPEGFIVSGVEFTSNEATLVSMFLNCVVAVAGVSLMIFELRSFARSTARVIITGLPGTSGSFPAGVLTKTEQRFAREVIELGVKESEAGDHSQQIKRYNAELCVDLFKRFVLHDSCEKLYIGGLARVPFLVAYGAFLRNVSSRIVYFDKYHRDGQWSLLSEEDCDLRLKNYELIETPNDIGEVGVALGLSTVIDKKQLPTRLQEHTTMLSPIAEAERNIVKNQNNLERLSNEIKVIIDKLSATETKKVHLFLSIQASLAIELGRCFQEGTHKNWVIHNFNAETGEYNWAVELSKSGVQEFSLNDF